MFDYKNQKELFMKYIEGIRFDYSSPSLTLKNNILTFYDKYYNKNFIFNT